MLKEKLLSVSIFCLSASIIIGAFIIANGMKANGEYVSSGLSSITNGLNNMGNTFNNTNNNGVVFRSTYDLTAASTYLGISESELIKLVNIKEPGIPYVKIGNDYVFSKNALDKWLEIVRVEIK